MKNALVWCFVVVGLLGVAGGYWGVYVLVFLLAAGLVWWVDLALFLGGPVCLVGALLALWRPRQRLAAGLGFFGFGLWLLLWALCLTVLDFELSLGI